MVIRSGWTGHEQYSARWRVGAGPAHHARSGVRPTRTVVRSADGGSPVAGSTSDQRIRRMVSTVWTPVRPLVVLVEDERDLAVMAGEFLRREGFDVVLAGDGRTGMQRLDDRAVDAVVLDLGLPDGNGLDVLRRLRRAGREVPVVVLTGRGQESDRVLGLELGADDYVVKPFSLPELAARLRAVLRRSSGARPASTRQVGELVVDTAAHETTVAGVPLPLRPLEHDLLAFLA